MQHLTDRALLLERHPYSESSAVVAVLTRRHGLVRLLARGLHRPKSRFYALLDFFDELELEWSPSKRSELALLQAGQMRVRRQALTKDLPTYRAALALVELAALGSRPGQVETALFDLLSAALDALQNHPDDPDQVRIRFQLAFLRQHGLFPALESCAACGKDAPPLDPGGTRAGFSAGAGGRLCAACANEARASGRRVGTMPLDVLLAAAKMGRDESVDAPAELMLRVRDFIERFLDYHLETQPRSHREFLAEANRNAPPQPSSSRE